MFDLCDNKVITKEDIIQMLVNLPDMGFSCSQNINVPDKFYQNIKAQVIECVSKGQREQFIRVQKEIQEQYDLLQKNNSSTDAV